MQRVSIDAIDNLYFSIKKLCRFVDANSVIVANDLLELRMAVLLKLSNPLIYIIHGDFDIYYRHCIEFQDHLDMIITYSRDIFRSLNSKLKTENHRKVKLIYYPVPDIKPGLERHSVLRIIFVGSLTKRKGVDLIPPIVKSIESWGINYNLSVVGSGIMQDWLGNQLKHCKNVELFGQLKNEEVLKLLIDHDILLFPTRSEGLPNVLVEAMKAGCVPIVSNIKSGIPDVIKNGHDGFIIEVDNQNAFSSTILTLSKNTQLLKRMKAEAVKKANSMFDPYINAKNYFEEFCKVKKNDNMRRAKVSTGPILNQPFLPNAFVRAIRKLKLNSNF